MTLVATYIAERQLTVVDIPEVPTYHMVAVPSAYDASKATPWFYNSRAVKIQTLWRRWKAVQVVATRRREAQAERDRRRLEYMDRRMTTLIHFVAWDGQEAADAAAKIQLWYLRRRDARRAH